MSDLFGDSLSPSNHRSLFAPSFAGPPSVYSDDDAPTSASSTQPPDWSSLHYDPTHTLLTLENASIPHSYRHAFSTLRAVCPVDEDRVDAREAVERIFSEAGVTRGRERILDILSASKKDSLRKEEVWCLIALAGMALEEDDKLPSLDLVDARRGDLPMPNLGSLVNGSMEERDNRRNVTSPGQDKPATIVTRQQSTPISTTPVRTRNTAALFSSSVDDPWNNPEQHRPSAMSSRSQRSGVSYHSQQNDGVGGDFGEEAEEENEPDDIHAALRNTATSASRITTITSTAPSTWENESYSATPQAYGQGTAGFGEHPGLGPRHGSFGGLGGNRLNGSSYEPPRNSAGSGLDRVRAALKAPEEHVTVNVLPDKEGMFMFQHRNYQIASARRGSRVVRRYSDFVWLLDCLNRRYPFRQLPLLPPKRLAVNGHYLSADAAFLERRRRGLHRFMNALVRHPVLSSEQLVIMFLTIPTELSVWRKQASITISEEFTDRPLPPDLESSLPPTLPQTFETVRSGLRRSAELYIQLCTLLERLEKRHEGIAADYSRLSSCLSSLTDASEATYAIDTNEIPLLNDGLTAVANRYTQAKQLLEDEAGAWDAGALEDLKTQRDTLVAMRELFDRLDRYGGDTIPSLTKRIESNRNKLSALRSKPAESIKPGEIEKVQESIRKDGEEIEKQRVRGILVKECVRDELVFFMGSVWGVGRLHQEWGAERVKYAELMAEVWRGLREEVVGMPTGE